MRSSAPQGGAVANGQLLVAQGCHGVDAGGAARWGVACQDRGGGQHQERHRQCQRVVGFHAEQERGDEARKAVGDRQPDAETYRGQGDDFAHYHPHDAAAFRAESHADSDFAGAARDGVCHAAVEADAGDEQREDGEAAAKSGKGALLADGLIDYARLRADVGNGNGGAGPGDDLAGGAGLAHDLPDGADERQRVVGGAQFEYHLSQTVDILGVRHVGHRRRVIFFDGVVHAGLGYTDDFDIRGAGRAANSDVAPDWILTREVLLCKFLVDHGDAWRFQIALLDIAAQQNRDLHGGEEGVVDVYLAGR